MSRRAQLVRSTDFEHVLRSGRRTGSASLALFVRDNEVGRPRVGFAVSRKLGNAVVRNRVKRRLRELVRPLVATSPAARDVVIVARPPATGVPYARLKEELNDLWHRGVES